MNDEDLDLDPPPNDSIIGLVIVCTVAFLLIGGVGALAINTAVDAKDKTEAIQESRVEFCRRLNARLTKLDEAIHTVFAGDDPATLAGIAVFDEALASEDCARTFSVGAP